MPHCKGYSRLLALALIASVGAGFGCAQQVGDIDRTGDNRLEKRDFAGTWYYRQTVKDVPATTPFMFTGIGSGVEKINWEISHGALIAYRAYELAPGADQDIVSTGVDETGSVEGENEGYNPIECAGTTEDCRNFKEAPVAAFTINGHFDVQRGYNASTGEENNVISENASDRLWNQREFFRVNWSANNLSNPVNFIDGSRAIQFTRYLSDADPLAKSIKQEYDKDGNMTYLEVTVKAVLQPSYYCYYSYELDCGPVETEIVHSFARVPDKQKYEPTYYDNHDMSKFGYFRNVRATYDRKRGYRRSNLIFLADKHNIFKTAYDEAGELIPVKDRDLRPVVYFMNEQMPEELEPFNKSIEENWNHAFRRAAAAAKGVDISEIPQMFVVCHNPVQDSDNLACGEPGRTVATGDVRVNHLYWVDDPSPAGPLGYGPSGTDPETGEIISGTAYVYGASVDTYATYALDLVDLILACEADEESQQCVDSIASITSGNKSQTDILSRLKPGLDPRAAKVADEDKVAFEMPTTLRDFMQKNAKPGVADRFINAQDNARPFDPGHEDRQLRKMRDNGLDLLVMNDDYVRTASQGQFGTMDDLDAKTLEDIRPGNFLSASRVRAFDDSLSRHFSENNILDQAFMDDRIVGLAVALADEVREMPEGDREEYMWQTLRGRIYEGVMLHELGHTLGLRHNFQGSYDSINFFDEYWELRQENMQPDPGFVNEIFENASTTENQRLGRVVDGSGNVKQLSGGMHEFQYSSIMDYGFAFNSDVHGIGKYDEAAIIYAYSYGYDGTVKDGKKVADRGYVEVFEEEVFSGNPDGKSLFQSFDNNGLAYTHVLEGFHYTNVVGVQMGGPQNLTKRRIMKYDDLLDLKEANDASRPVEVPYMFCTDDWVGVDSSCHRWDAGADPYEQTMNVIDAYHQYYYFNNYARDSLSFSPWNVFQRVFSRYLTPLTNIYQQLYFAQEYGVQGIYRWLAANAGLNLIGEIMTNPRDGEHVMGAGGDLVHCRDSDSVSFLDGNGDSTSTTDLCNKGEIFIDIQKGVGRSTFTAFDYDSGHEYYYWPTESGHFYDYLAAVLAMTQSQATVRGVDVQSDSLAYSIPYYLQFDDELNNLFGNIWTEHAERVGARVLTESSGVQRLVPPVLSGVQLTSGPTAWDPATGAEVQNGFPVNMGNVTPRIRPYQSYGMRYYALLYGMAFFSANQDLSYAEANQIFRLGNGEQVTAGPGFELVQCSDPLNGHVYAALKDLNDATATPAVEMIETCRAQADDYRANPNTRFLLNNTIGNINLMRGMYDVFGSAL